ncbi:MAG: phosphomannomutase/phosphoglucomutase [Clostridiales bacterium]|nr:phosphomannomutase/phosphoglucomutase [Clostridiales bacterium]
MDLKLKTLQRGSVLRARQEDLTDNVVIRIAYAFAQWLADSFGKQADSLTVCVGRDSRSSGERLLRAFCEGLSRADADIYDCGLATTPAMQMCLELDEINADGAVMITASAAGEEMNGFKLYSSRGALTEEELSYILIKAQDMVVPKRLVRPLDIMASYRERLVSRVRDFLADDAPKPLLGLKVIVDASNGSGGFFAAFLEDLGADTSCSINLEPTGRFSSHLPNPESNEAFKDLSQKVLENGADLGVLLDADADRVALVDEKGRAINRNRLIALVAAIMLEDEKNLTFVTDSVTSSGLTRFITEWGGNHYRFKRGYKNVIGEAERLSAEGIKVPVAIETSGHAAMAENFFIDDGVFLATKVICEAMWRKKRGETLTSLIDELQEPVESTEIRLPIIQEDYRTAAGYVIEAVLSKSLTNPQWRLAVDNREGVRVLFSIDRQVDCAWFMLRLSVHDPVMVLNAESEVPGGLKIVLSELYEVLAQDNEELDLKPFEDVLNSL